MAEETRRDNNEGSDEARDLCRTLLQSNPRMPYKEIRLSAENLGLKLSRWTYSAVQRELAGTVGGKKPAEGNGARKGALKKSTPAPAREARAGKKGAVKPQLKDDSRIKSPIMAFAVKFLRERPDAAYKEVRAAAEKEGLKLYPISYGRAQALLGIVKTRPRRSPARNKPKQDAAPRTLVQGGTHGSAHVEGFLDKAHALATERDRYRAALLELRDVLLKALRPDA